MKQSYDIVLDLNLPEKVDSGVNQPLRQTQMTAKDLQKELLVLRLAFGKLKAAAVNAVAPLAAVFVRGVSNMVFGAIRLVKTLGQVISGLFGITNAGKKTEKTVVKTGKALQRSVASFDQLERLQKNSGGGSSTVTTQVPVADTGISQEAQAIVDKINAILAPLKSIDTFPIQWAVARLQEQFKSFAGVAGSAMGSLWTQHLTPFITWVVEQLLPSLAYLANYALQFLQVALGEAGAGFNQLLTGMKPVAEFLRSVVISVITQTGLLFTNMRTAMETDGSALKNLFVTLGDAMGQLWQAVSPVLVQLHSLFTENFQGIGMTVFTIMQGVLNTISSVITTITALLTGNWSQAWSGMGSTCKNAVNVIIGVLNLLLRGLTGALNGVIALFNNMKIKVPDWVPQFGGKTFGFQLKTVTAPQIPYLAKGAVLPANRPFLAMVGDQKHGTNIEAPLATITEAVSLVMQEQSAAMMAGFQALLQENRQLRHTVEGISVGDAVIGRAAQRYNSRQAVIRGGVV